jgi:hypothetical protein
MGVKIVLKCDLCPREDSTFMRGEDPARYGWRVTVWVCVCPECNKRNKEAHHASTDHGLQRQQKDEAGQP